MREKREIMGREKGTMDLPMAEKTVKKIRTIFGKNAREMHVSSGKTI